MGLSAEPPAGPGAESLVRRSGDCFKRNVAVLARSYDWKEGRGRISPPPGSASGTQFNFPTDSWTFATEEIMTERKFVTNFRRRKI